MFICIVFSPLEDSSFIVLDSDIHFFHADAFLFMVRARIKKIELNYVHVMQSTTTKRNID